MLCAALRDAAVVNLDNLKKKAAVLQADLV